MNNKMILMSPMGYTGYGVVGWNLAKNTKQLGCDVHVHPITVQPGYIPPLDNQEDDELLGSLINNEYDPKSPCVKIWHQFDLELRVGTGKYFGFPFFELDRFNDLEKKHLKVPDELIVSSQWAKNVLIDSGATQNINIVHLGIDSTIFDHRLSDKNIKKDNDPYVFIMIGKWEVRKGYDILLNLFNSAFSINDNVELWLMGSSDPTCFSQKEMDEWHSFYSSGPLASKIRIIPRVKTQNDVANLISRADCGLFVSRAEGWNLELLEVMSMNKPVITTNYSAHTEFCDKDNAFLIDITETETAFDGKWFLGNGNWAKIGQVQIDQIIEYMRYVYKNNIRTNPNGVKTGQKYSWQHSAEQLIQCIS